ncbi:MAG: hypothetical protein IT353_21460 [Gemmatimonadaceae bacterium]|nr:hypothetical protein [Gemmatimonadaceae bacterium]
MTWICLELPAIPEEQVAEAAAAALDAVAIECNSGAERVIALVAPGWDDALTDEQLNAVITAGLR